MACTKKLPAVITEAGWPATDRRACQRSCKDALSKLQNQGHRPGSIVRFYAVSTCLPDVPKNLVSVVSDSLSSPIEAMALALGFISSGSEIHVQWSSAQCEFVGIGLVLFQLTSEWN